MDKPLLITHQLVQLWLTTWKQQLDRSSAFHYCTATTFGQQELQLLSNNDQLSRMEFFNLGEALLSSWSVSVITLLQSFTFLKFIKLKEGEADKTGTEPSQCKSMVGTQQELWCQAESGTGQDSFNLGSQMTTKPHHVSGHQSQPQCWFESLNI